MYDGMISATSRLQHHKIYLSTALTHFLAFLLVARLHQPISLHAHWSSSSAAYYKFTVRNYYSAFFPHL